MESFNKFVPEYTLQVLKGLSFPAIRNSSEILWRACTSLHLKVDSFTLSMIYLQKYTLLNPQVKNLLEASNQDFAIEDVCCACVTTMLLTGENFKKVSDVVDAIYPNTIEDSDKVVSKVNQIQREILETNCFDMSTHCAPNSVIKLAKSLDLAEDVAYMAWLIAIDAYETTAVLRFSEDDVAAAALAIAYAKQPSMRLFKSSVPRWITFPGLKTSIKILLAYFKLCEKNKLKTKSQFRLNEDHMKWLYSLENHSPTVSKTDVKIRDLKASLTDTVRFITHT